MKAPDVLDHADLRSFLKALRASHVGGPLGLKELARRAGFKSPSSISMFLQGKRALGPQVALRLGEALGLSPKQKKYLVALAQFDSAKSRTDKAAVQETLLRLKQAPTEKSLTLAQYRILSRWYYPAIYEALSLGDFQRDLQWIAKRLYPKVTIQEVRQALGDLRNVGLIEEKDGRLVPTHRAMTTADDCQEIAVLRYHEAMIELAGKALDLPLAVREMNGLTVGVSAKDLPLIKEKIRKLRSELNEMLSGNSQPEEVYQLNIQFFPLTKSLKGVSHE